MIQLQSVTHTFRLGSEVVHVLDNISLNVTNGDSVAIVGPSGSGKSTLLHIVAGLLAAQSGSVCVGGRDLALMNDREKSQLRASTLGFVFQSFHLQGDATALENVELPMMFNGVARSERRNRARVALGDVGLAARENHYPSQLSGGEMQRVALARAAVMRPSVLLADEPTGNLDSKNGKTVMELLTAMQTRRSMTLLLVTHSSKVAAYARRTLVLEEGRFVNDSA